MQGATLLDYMITHASQNVFSGATPYSYKNLVLLFFTLSCSLSGLDFKTGSNPVLHVSSHRQSVVKNTAVLITLALHFKPVPVLVLRDKLENSYLILQLNEVALINQTFLVETENPKWILSGCKLTFFNGKFN